MKTSFNAHQPQLIGLIALFVGIAININYFRNCLTWLTSNMISVRLSIAASIHEEVNSGTIKHGCSFSTQITVTKQTNKRFFIVNEGQSMREKREGENR